MSWRYTDGRGVECVLDTRPRRVAVVDLLATSTLWAAGIRPVAAAVGANPGDACLSAVGFVPDGVLALDRADDPTPDLALLASVGADLVIDRTHGSTLSTLEESTVDGVIGLTLKAPGQSLPVLFAEVARLAAALGAPEADPAAFLLGCDRVRSVAGASVAFAFVRGGLLSVVDPDLYPWLVTLRDLGVLVAGPARLDWSAAADLDVDLLLVFDEDTAALPTDPGLRDLARSRPGRVLPWSDRWHAFDPTVQGELLSDLATRLSDG